MHATTPRTSSQRWNWTVGGKLNIHLLLLYIFGVIFLTAILIYAALVPNPSEFAQRVFITVLALAGASIAALLPGVLDVQLPYVKAGGALAVFIAILGCQSIILEKASQFTRPVESPLIATTAFLKMVDEGHIDSAWEALDIGAKETFAKDRDMFRKVFATARAPLGKPIDRTQVGMQEFTSPNGYPLGIYSGLTYRTKFADSTCRMEQLHLRATDGSSWRVFDYNVSAVTIPCQ